MNLFSIIGLIIGISTAVLAVLTIIKAHRKIHCQWALVCAAVSVWGFGGFFIGQASTESLALLWWRIAYIGVIFIPVLYFHFFISFFESKKTKFIILLYIVTLVFQYLNIFTGIFINQVRFAFNEFYYLSSPTSLYLIFVLFFYYIVVHGYLLILRRYRKSQGIKRNQLLYFLFTIPIGFVGGLFAFLPVFEINIYPYLNLLIAVFPFAIAIAIFKHQLLDIKIIIQRGIIYSSILSIIVGFYVFLVFVLGFFFQQATDATIILAAGISTVLGIYGVPPLEKYFRKKTDKIFFKDKYDYSQAVYELSEILNRNIELERLLLKTCKKLQIIFKVSLVTITLPSKNLTYDSEEKVRESRIKLEQELVSTLVNEKINILTREEAPRAISEMEKNKVDQKIINAAKRGYKKMEKFGIEVLIVVLLDKKIIGLVVLTKKLSGDIYDQEDLRLLETFSYQAAVAIEKAQLFQQVKEYSVELEMKVKKRTAKIQGLQEDQKEMMQEMAHGLQTPLTILKGELSQMSDKLKESKEIIAIERSITRVSNFIYGMLRLAKLESNAENTKKENFDLSELLNELIESYEIITKEKNIKIIHKIAKHINFYGDEKAIEEMITNLVSNSVKYMKEEGDKIISLNLERSQDNIELIIADNGIGIKSRDIPKLFQRFYRVDNKESNKQKGTGLGLAICEQIIERHNGTIKVISEVNKGTSFIIKFPLVNKENRKK